ncbi:MAG: ABC transporter ATP-binding protein [Lachnospiraceae bacterium]|nr:ABC transporter ATP-binding protein [Lachnospiraceae bacterium]
MVILELVNVSKIYGSDERKVQALTNVSLKIERGEMIAIMGTSGSGKSTLLNILGTIDGVSSGEYFLEEKRIKNYSEKEKAELRNKKIGFVMQDFGLISHYNVEKNVQLPLEYIAIKQSEKKKRSDDVLKRVGLENKKKSYPCQLSGGQRQRVAISRALINNADILLCDEPTGALDSKTTKEIMELFVELNQLGKTIIIVTHDKMVAEYCSKVVRIEDGHIVQ